MAASAPVQTRSKKTLEAILSATEELLDEKEFDRITIAEIVACAGCTTGSFYARFDGKEALLPMLYARYEESLPNLFETLTAFQSGARPSLAEMLGATMAAITRVYDERPNLMRAIVLYARTRPQIISASTLDQRKTLIAQTVEAFEPFYNEIGHTDPARAVELTLFVTIATLRERILFPNAPNAAVLAGNRADFIDEITTIAVCYLKTQQGKLK